MIPTRDIHLLTHPFFIHTEFRRAAAALKGAMSWITECKVITIVSTARCEHKHSYWQANTYSCIAVMDKMCYLASVNTNVVLDIACRTWWRWISWETDASLCQHSTHFPWLDVFSAQLWTQQLSHIYTLPF